MRADDMEEGSSHSDFSTSGDHQTEEVRTVKHTLFLKMCKMSGVIAESNLLLFLFCTFWEVLLMYCKYYVAVFHSKS